MACEDCKRSVHLLRENDAGYGMGQGHRAKRQKQICAVFRFFRPAIGRADRKDELLSAAVSLTTDPLREHLRAQLAASAIEQNAYGRRAAALTFQCFKQCFFGFEGFDQSRRIR